MNDLVDLDDLRASCEKIHFFGLGFIQVKMRDGNRYHFYHPSLEAFVENPHDHRYHFTSSVLRGVLFQRIWKIVEAPYGLSAIQRFDACSPDVKPPDTRTPVRVDVVSAFVTSAGSGYYLDHTTYHQAFRHGPSPCITYLRRGPRVKEFSSILCLDGKTEACPFSQPGDEKALWEIVRDCL
jgi:hypothetical protein